MPSIHAIHMTTANTLWGFDPIWLGYLAAAVILSAWRAWREK